MKDFSRITAIYLYLRCLSTRNREKRYGGGTLGILSRGKEQSLGGENSRDPAVSRAVPRDVHRTIIILIRKWREPNASAVQMVGRDRGRTFWRLPVPSLILGRGPSRRLNEQTEFEAPCTGQAGYIYLHHGNTAVHDECFS